MFEETAPDLLQKVNSSASVYFSQTMEGATGVLEHGLTAR